MDSASGLAWPLARLPDAIDALARATGFAAERAVDAGRGSGHPAFETDSFDVPYAALDRTLQHAGPALLKLTSSEGDAFLAVIEAADRRAIRLLAPDGTRVTVPRATVATWLRAHLDQPVAASVDRLLAEAGIPAERQEAARRSILGTHLGASPVTRCWLLRPKPEATLWQHMRHAAVPRRFAVFLLAYAGISLASVGSWWLIGAAALEGRFDPGSLLAWTFLLLSVVPLGLFAMWSQGVFILGTGGLLKLQLLAGALKLDPDDTRHAGVGQHLASVIESESVEALALGGGFYALAAVFDLMLAGGVFLTTSSALPLVFFLATMGMLGGVAVVYVRRRTRWTAARLRLTHDLVEQMVGHRTRLVQESDLRRHQDSDVALERYLDLSKRMDRAARLLSVMPQVWLLVGLAALAPQLIAGDGSPAALAVALGATLLAFTAMGKMTASLSTLADAAIGWKQIASLVHALRKPESLGQVDASLEPMDTPAMIPTRGPLLAAHDLAYRFRDRPSPVLQRCGFRIAAGDRIHLSGVSGGGKSTLVSLLTGLRAPDAGLLLLHGLDRATLGSRAWQRRVAAAPQFHENYLFNDTLAFNLLMGRRWPPTPEDLGWAETVCRRLGLGDLIDRMPGSLFQVVGETGWQLSHGERSRVYMARALLQGADLVILDESFAELDPDSLARCFREATELAAGLVVVAHT